MADHVVEQVCPTRIDNRTVESAPIAADGVRPWEVNVKGAETHAAGRRCEERRDRGFLCHGLAVAMSGICARV